jgi:hypothetical protein
VSRVLFLLLRLAMVLFPLRMMLRSRQGAARSERCWATARAVSAGTGLDGRNAGARRAKWL